MRAVVTGGAGFLGSHLCRRLLTDGWEVACVDSLVTGSRRNVEELESSAGFVFEQADVTEPWEVRGSIDWVFHLASLASPPHYRRRPIETLLVGSVGTHRMLDLAVDRGAGFFLASTSEVYGDPRVHPQPESYRGNVDPVGPRSMYDESKRYAEAAATAWRGARGVRTRIVRIFNTYGPRMSPRDGRAVPTFVAQALAGEPITVHGDGSQTRSLCYVDDLIEGFMRLVEGDLEGPVNLGNPEEVTVLELARRVRGACASSSEIVFIERPPDDPELRRPDISLARDRLGWEPKVPLEQGLRETVEWIRSRGHR